MHIPSNRTEKKLENGEYIAPNIAMRLHTVIKMATSSGKLQGQGDESTTQLGVNTTDNFFITNIGESVTNALTNGNKRLVFANLGTQEDFFTINNIRLTIGVDTAYDGGDLNFYLGTFLVAQIPAATLAAVTANNAAIFNLRVPSVIQIGTGTYSASSGTVSTLPTTISIGASSPTVAFKGTVNIQVGTSNRESCGTWCTDCGGAGGTKGTKCVGGKCEICTSVSFDGADVT